MEHLILITWKEHPICKFEENEFDIDIFIILIDMLSLYVMNVMIALHVCALSVNANHIAEAHHLQYVSGWTSRHLEIGPVVVQFRVIC
jgi:hypothetical protein